MYCIVQWLLISDFSANVMGLRTDPTCTSRDRSFTDLRLDAGVLPSEFDIWKFPGEIYKYQIPRVGHLRLPEAEQCNLFDQMANLLLFSNLIIDS